MSSTEPRFGWPIPEDTDPLTDGAAAIRMLAAAVSDSLGVFGWRVVGGQGTTPANGTDTIDYAAAGFVTAPFVAVTPRANNMPSQLTQVYVGNVTSTSMSVNTRGESGVGAVAVPYSWLAIGRIGPSGLAATLTRPAPLPELDDDTAEPALPGGE